MPSRSSSRVLTDHDEIRQWAEQRKARPSCVRGTGGSNDIGMLRLDFPGYSGEQSLQPISWDDFFEKFDERNLSLLVQDETAGGARSNFNKLISRETSAESRNRSQKRTGSRSASQAGSRSSGGRQAARSSSRGSGKRSSGSSPISRSGTTRTAAKKSSRSAGRSSRRKAA